MPAFVSPIAVSKYSLSGQFTNYPLKQLDFYVGTLKGKNPGEIARLILSTSVQAGALTAYGTLLDQDRDLMEAFGEGLLDIVTDVAATPGPATRELMWLGDQARRGNVPSGEQLLGRVVRVIPGVSGVYRNMLKMEKMIRGFSQ